ncbi:MAG: transglutaminase domain-containing protein [Pseudomonadota bacterium]
MNTTASPDPALAPTALIDSDHPAVAAFARENAQGTTERERAVALYLAVRDRFRYDPYRLDLRPEAMRASSVLAVGHGWCVTKAALLAAACRAAGIGARVGYADVRNHLSTERMRQVMKTDVFFWHGYTDVRVEGRWWKAPPAFHIELTERFGLLPLDWDGASDSIYHPFDKSGQRHMEYLNQHGAFDDMPLERIVADFERHYPWMRIPGADLKDADFDADVARETP